MKLYFIILLFFLSTILLAQDTELRRVKYTPEYKFIEGLYLDFNQVISGKPLKKNRIITNVSKNDFAYYKKILSTPVIQYYDKYGIKQEINKTQLWGYSKKGILFIQKSGAFNRLSIIGKLCHFIAVVTVQHDIVPQQYMGYNSMGFPSTSKSDEMMQFILNFESGDIYNYSSNVVAELIKKDEELYQEFMDLRKRKRRQLAFYYMRKYNARNPLFLPVQ